MAEKIASTQEHLDILDIRDNLVLLRQGGVALVLQANAVNFDLLSEREQDAMIAAYSALLNSLSFPLQIVIRSRKLDISSYLTAIEQRAQRQPNPYLKEKIRTYKEFISGLVQKREILDKRFYLVIPYYEIALASPSVLDSFRRLLGMEPKPRAISRAGLLQRAKTDLEPKKDHLIKQLSRLGIQARQLTTPELIELYYRTYNPEHARVQRLEKGISPYTTAMVEPAITEVTEEGTERHPPEKKRSTERGGEGKEK